jgi:ribosomal protein S18 acetylase RimI-like enzyme
MITPRRATKEDMPLLVVLMREFYAESEFVLDGQWATNSFCALLSDDSKGAVWIVFHHGEPAGYVVLTLRHSMEYGGLDGFIDDLYVRPADRRKGLGRAALKAVFAECERRSVLALHVEAGRSNAAAQALYRSLGLGALDDARQLLTVRFDSPIGHSKAHLQGVTERQV